MTIEKRHSQRVALHLDAQLLYRGRCCKVVLKNLSIEGIFLNTGDLSIPNGTLVDLEFSLADHRWQISGLVVHQAMKGIGVMFRVSQPELFQMASERTQQAAVLPSVPPDQQGGLWQG